MVEITSIAQTDIELKGVSFDDKDMVEDVMAICHRLKHLYMEGRPYGKKTRRKNKIRMKKWAQCPEICFVYLVSASDRLKIHILVSDVESLLERYTQSEIDYFTQMYVQDVADEIIKYFDEVSTTT